MRIMVRSMLVTEIFVTATKARIGTGDDTAALTLMSTDIERINMSLRSLHEIWACIIQVALASYMLFNQLGVVFIAPIGVVIACFIGLVILMKFTGDSQRNWMTGVQKRVGLTATVIASMKNLKISGLSGAISDLVQKLRVEELAAGGRFRKIVIITAVFAYTPLIMSPPLTFALTQRTLGASRIFTSLSWLLLLTNPLVDMFESIPQLLSGLACLGRIQVFLESETRHDFREISGEKKQNLEKVRSFDSKLDSEHPVVIRDGKFGWEADKFALQNVNIQITKSSLTIVVGSVGSGKSTLCKALLGEIPFSEGNIIMSTRFPHVGFCDQTAFLSNGTIRDNIIGFSVFNNERYTEVIKATALAFDIDTLPQGDRTNVGSDGIILSGGQKQRVSLARALYLQSDLLVLDDIFSGLDANTEDQVFQQVFGPEGLLKRRRSTVILCTHSVRHLSAADYIIALGDGSILEQGSFNTLMASQGYVQRLGLISPFENDPSCHEHDENLEKITKVDGVDSNNGVRESKRITTNSASSLETSQTRQVGDKTVYKHYFKSMGLSLAALSFLFAALWGFFQNFPNVWLSYWSSDVTSEHPNHSYAYYAGIYALLQICGMISLLLLGICLFIFSVRRAGAHLHREALKTLIRAPLGFFTNTDTGVIINLFSQDLNLIDTELPSALLNTLFCVSLIQSRL